MLKKKEKKVSDFSIMGKKLSEKSIIYIDNHVFIECSDSLAVEKLGLLMCDVTYGICNFVINDDDKFIAKYTNEKFHNRICELCNKDNKKLHKSNFWGII